MKRPISLAHEFVDAIPSVLKERTLYVSIAYATAVHRCCCGCGKEVVTPLSPTDWKLTYDGVSVSLYPSIGNWGFDCQSHYWIKNGAVSWADDWQKTEIDAGRALDRRAKRKYYDTANAGGDRRDVVSNSAAKKSRGSLGAWLRKWWS